ncbi:MAG: metallophosphoesterase [Chloroflexi bacterium]|nr:metallophosphoesterase [Chloroflexota bacterium]
MRIVHFSDLHLDSTFTWAGALGDAARRRRQALRDTLLRIVELTREERADALLSGGDLYEHERSGQDTGEFLRQAFASLDPIPVYLAPGNHDWYGPDSLYARVDWSSNVHVFSEPALRPTQLSTGITLWGAAHCAPANTDNFLDGFRTEGLGVHLALFHGAENSWFSEQGEGKQPHAPFDAAQIAEAGIDHAFLGHYHRPKDSERHTYPGNPDPLAFGEDGKRAAVLATIDATGRVRSERHIVAQTAVHDIETDISGCTTQQQIRDRIAEQVDGLTGFARLTVRGEVEPAVSVTEGDLRDTMNSFEAVQIHLGAMRAGYDFEALRSEPTVRGQFVADVLDAGLDPQEERRVLMTGLRALEGRRDLEVL